MSDVKLHWTSHLSEDEKEEFAAKVANAEDVLERAISLIERKISDNAASMRKDTNFASSAWTHQMADNLGYERALSELINLLKVK